MSVKSGNQSLKDIFGSNFYRIPDYQRGYAWGKEQLEDFWEDLINSEEHKHYTGVLSLEKVSCEEKEKWQRDIMQDDVDVYYVVDGQQRLTTSIILIKVILDFVEEIEKRNKKENEGFEMWFAGEKLDELKKKYISKNTQRGTAYFFGYTCDNPSYEFLKTKIFNNESSLNKDEKSIYTQNLENAKIFFKNKLKEDRTQEKLEQIFKILTQNFIFNVYVIDNDFDVYVAFETMNNRGKPLSSLELLKNRLIYLSTKEENEQGKALRDIINDCWKAIYNYLGKNPENILKDDDFLKIHWLMYFDEYERSSANPHKEFLLKEHFILKNLLDKTITVADIENYAMNLKESIKHYYFLHNLNFPDYIKDNKIGNEIIEWLEKINRLKFGAFEPLLVAVLQKRTKDEKFDDKEFIELLKHIEKFIFLMFSVSYKQANYKAQDIYKTTFQYFTNKKTLQEVSNFVYETYNSDVELESLKNKIESYFRQQKKGYFEWKGLRYFLFEYEEYLRKKYKNNAKKIEWSNFTQIKKDCETIEHILPQNIKGVKEWEQIIDQTEGIKRKQGKNREHNINQLTNSLGNLVPLSQHKNSKIQNKPYSEKIKEFERGSYAEIEVSQIKKWDKKAIEKRSEKLLDFLFERWEINQIIDFWSNEQYGYQDWAKEQKNIKKELIFPIK